MGKEPLNHSRLRTVAGSSLGRVPGQSSQGIPSSRFHRNSELREETRELDFLQFSGLRSLEVQGTGGKAVTI